MFNMLGGREKFITSFLRALRMPRLKSISIFVDLQYTGIDETDTTKLLSNLSRALLPVAFADPLTCLSSLTFNNHICSFRILSEPTGFPRNVPDNLHHSPREGPYHLEVDSDDAHPSVLHS